MVNRGEEKVWVQMNVVPRSTGNTNSGTRELTLKCKLKCYFKPMNNPLGVSPSKGISLPFYIPQLVKSLPFFIPEA